MKHTPGPWRATKHTDTKGWTVSAGNSIASVRPLPEVEANARLIAAAPEQQAKIDRLEAVNQELVGALENIIRYAPEGATYDNVALPPIRQAIAKATQEGGNDIW